MPDALSATVRDLLLPPTLLSPPIADPYRKSLAAQAAG